MRPALLFALSLTLAATGVEGQGRFAWRAEDRVLISSFARVTALARDTRSLYIATDNGLLVYEPDFQSWQLPITIEDGFPARTQIAALAVEPLGRDLLLGTIDGRLFRWRTGPRSFERMAELGQPIVALIATAERADAAVYVRTPREWFRIDALGFVPRPVRSTEVSAAVLARGGAMRDLDPTIAAWRATLGLDRRGRRWPITSFVADDRRDRFWFGTDGGFVFRFDALIAQPDWLWYGAASRAVPALAIHEGMIWFGQDGRGPRRGVASVNTELQRFTLHDAEEGAPAGRVNQIVAGGGAVSFATADGLYDFARNRWTRSFNEEVLTVLSLPTSRWVGLRSSLVVQANGVADERLLAGVRVNRLRARGDTVWVATSRGIFRFAAGLQAKRVEGLPERAFLDVAHVGGSVFALVADGLYTSSDAAWTFTPTPVTNGLGTLTTLHASDVALWVGGAGGVGRYHVERGEWSFYRVPADIPEGPVTDIAEQGTQVWLATPAGALRMLWRS